MKEKSFKFVLDIVDLFNRQLNQIISKQLMRSGTSIGTNIDEGL